MEKSNPIIVIPSRLSATRLPNKPLLLINNLPMIVQVVNRALESKIHNILVASADSQINEVIKQYFKDNSRVDVVLTDPTLSSGTDRIKQALDIYDKNKQFNMVINVQGDLPTISQNAISQCYELLQKDYVDIATLVAEIEKKEDNHNSNIVKAVLSFSESKDIAKALYFSRSYVPYNAITTYHHIGIYGYRRNILDKFTSLAPSNLEIVEKLEQLRALENNINIYAKITTDIPFGVDVYEDLAKAELILKNIHINSL